MRGTVLVFLKAPVAGRVKTRLGAGIGYGRAAALFRVLTAQTIGEAVKGEWRTVLAVDPPEAVHASCWPRDLARIAQSHGDLGRRMAHAFGTIGQGPVVIIGADAPALRARHLRAAFHTLKGADAVFGPAEDGGYWLIGLARRRPAPDLFSGVRWSSEHALADTLKSLPATFHARMLETLSDIDEESDLYKIGPRASA